MRMCKNLRAKTIAGRLGELARVDHVRESPISYRNEEGKVVDRTGENLHIVGAQWYQLMPHLKLALTRALAKHGLTFTFRIVTDQQIKNVFVGNEHRKYRMAGQSVHNSLADFVAEDFDLVIVKLGFLGHKNIAAPGALKEALLIREDLNLATWVVQDPDRPWKHSRDDEMEYYISERFERVAVEGADPGIEEMDNMGCEDVDEGLEGINRPSPVYDDLSMEPSLDDGFDLPGENGKGNDRPVASSRNDDDEFDLPGEHNDRGGRRR